MADMRHAGAGFPNGPADLASVFALPSPNLLMLSTEARYHYDEAVRAGKKVTWRAIPRIGKRPAELGWSPSKFVAETINLTDAPSLPITDFIPWNEIDLQDERGDHEDDWSGLADRFALIGGWGFSVVQMLKQWSPLTRIHWPAFTPDHDALGNIDQWRAAAELCDVLDFHAYDTLDKIRAQYEAHRAAFPVMPLALTEWHCKGDMQEEAAVLQWLAETMQDDPLFDAAYFFIWRWWDHPGWWDDAWDVEHNPERLALFQNPPVYTPEEPPVPEPVASPQGIDVASYQGYPDWNAVKASGISFAITKLSEDTGYVNPTFDYNWAQMKNVGIQRGAYHFARPEGNDAEEEADALCTRLINAGFETTDMVALDLEAGYGDLGPWTLTFCRWVQERLGVVPLIYTGRWFSEPHNLGSYPEIADYPLWLAAYQPTMPSPPAPWNVVSFWQYSSSGQIPGIVGDVDLNVFNGTAENLPLMGKLPAETPAPSAEYSVGGGILAEMQAHGDQAACDEIYVKSGSTDAYSHAYGRSGALYVYLPATGAVHRYDPAA
jgi:GH25 family lysozyme M1 (1,4-beta-N-acetylmuramidase)